MSTQTNFEKWLKVAQNMAAGHTVKLNFTEISEIKGFAVNLHEMPIPGIQNIIKALEESSQYLLALYNNSQESYRMVALVVFRAALDNLNTVSRHLPEAQQSFAQGLFSDGSDCLHNAGLGHDFVEADLATLQANLKSFAEDVKTESVG